MICGNVACALEASRQIYSHVQFSVVQEILHRVEAGEPVLDLRAIGDHTRGVGGLDSARDVDELDVREVGKLLASNLIDSLEKRENIFAKNLFL